MTERHGETPILTEPARLRDCLGTYATGVTVVTARTPDGGLVGITVNSFASVSLDPPLVLISLQRTLRSLPEFTRATHFGINVLRADQGQISSRFARSGGDKWESVSYTDHATGVPLLSGALATLVCERYATHDGGDHIIELGRVLDASHDAAGEPLVFHRGRYCRLESV